MGNTIKLKSVADLVREGGATECNHYQIEGYQRGYRWRSDEQGQVQALLRDVKAFMHKPRASDEIYCLQPIVVVRHKSKGWEVIDGQQRLTTIYLILKHLGADELFSIEYAYRPDSAKFLQTIDTMTEVDKNPDYHFMSKAYGCIKAWFEQENLQDSGFKRKFLSLFLDQVKVIWYEVKLHGSNPEEQEREKIDVFNRLNIGKIPLDDAELIRALFINELTADNAHEEVLMQSVFASEWQEIETFLRQESVWGYLNVKQEGEVRNRILTLFELATHTKADEKRATYQHYERLLRESSDPRLEVEKLWQEIKRIKAFIASWWSGRTLYHRVGLCLALNLMKIEELIGKSTLPKDGFRQELETRLKQRYEAIKFEELGYDKPSEAKQVLLLFNVLTLEGMADTAQHRFPFELYNGQEWSLEHIHAQLSEEIKERKQIKEYIDYALSALAGINEVVDIEPEGRKLSEIKADFKALQGRIDELKDVELREEFAELRGDLERTMSRGQSLHDMDNLALLSRGNNSALSNSIFPMKRQKLLELERTGKFIPPCTKAVFLKAYSPLGAIPYIWGEDDRRAYLEEMKRVLSGYVNVNYTDISEDNDGE